MLEEDRRVRARASRRAAAQRRRPRSTASRPASRRRAPTCTSPLTQCHGSPTSLPKPPGMRTTIGAANRLAVRQRIVPQLLSCSVRGIGVLAELNLGDRHQPGDRHPDRAADDAFFGQARVEHARVAELASAVPRSRDARRPCGPRPRRRRRPSGSPRARARSVRRTASANRTKSPSVAGVVRAAERGALRASQPAQCHRLALARLSRRRRSARRRAGSGAGRARAAVERRPPRRARPSLRAPPSPRPTCTPGTR